MLCFLLMSLRLLCEVAIVWLWLARRPMRERERERVTQCELMILLVTLPFDLHICILERDVSSIVVLLVVELCGWPLFAHRQ